MESICCVIWSLRNRKQIVFTVWYVCDSEHLTNFVEMEGNFMPPLITFVNLNILTCSSTLSSSRKRAVAKFIYSAKFFFISAKRPKNVWNIVLCLPLLSCERSSTLRLQKLTFFIQISVETVQSVSWLKSCFQKTFAKVESSKSPWTSGMLPIHSRTKVIFSELLVK